jgi:hypothetical protein
MASTWVATVSNETITQSALNDAVANGYFTGLTAIPTGTQNLTKSDISGYVQVQNTGGYASKASNELLVKSDLLPSFTVTIYAKTSTGAPGRRIWYSLNDSTMSAATQVAAVNVGTTSTLIGTVSVNNLSVLYLACGDSVGVANGIEPMSVGFSSSSGSPAYPAFPGQTCSAASSSTNGTALFLWCSITPFGLSCSVSTGETGVTVGHS